MKRVTVPGGICIQANIFENRDWLPPDIALTIADPPYGNIVGDKWDQWDPETLAMHLAHTVERVGFGSLPGAHFILWGGFGKPNDRPFFQAILDVERDTPWRMAELITWRKKRAYGTKWRCLAAREECARFVLGDIKKPRVFNVPYTDEKRGYAGFNADHPAKSAYKRMTMVWDHASDMTRNKPHACFKPPQLSETMIGMCTNRNDLVLDLFAGSGEVSRVAREMGRVFVAVEGDPATFDSLVARLNE